MPSEYENLIRLARVARGLEQAGGFYNASKLFWAALFSEEIRASNEQGIPKSAEELDREAQVAYEWLKSRGAKPELIAALEHGRAGVRENRTIAESEIPAVFVCRTCGEMILGQPSQPCPTCGAHLLTWREFLPVYLLEPLSPQQVLAALASGATEIEAAVKGLSDAQMAQSPRAGEWAIRDLLSHLLVAQGLCAGRVEKMLTKAHPEITSLAAWRLENMEALSASETLKRYRTSRQKTVDRLKEISAQDWWRTGHHDEFGEVTVLQQTSYFAKHEPTHLPQIAAIRRAIGA